MTQLQRIAIDPSQRCDRQITLTAEQQHYLGRVLRLRNGDRFIVMDGGQRWLSELREANQAQILEAIETHTELPIAVTLVMAMPKGSGMDEIVRQATELGVRCIAPVISDRSILQPSLQKLDRWRRIAGEAAEQSERQIVPTILEPVRFESSLSQWQGSRYLCEARGEFPHLLKLLNEDFPDAIVLAIGPEGGWTDSEIAAAIEAGFQPVSLGQQILRAVTAPIVALALVNGALADSEGDRINS